MLVPAYLENSPNFSLVHSFLLNWYPNHATTHSRDRCGALKERLMALPKKRSRLITVENQSYRWMVSGNDGWIDLYLELDDEKGKQLMAKFDYHHKEIKMNNGVSLKQQFAVTPDIVRQTIIYEKKNGWKPSEKGKPLDLHHIDDKIKTKKNL